MSQTGVSIDTIVETRTFLPLKSDRFKSVKSFLVNLKLGACYPTITLVPSKVNGLPSNVIAFDAKLSEERVKIPLTNLLILFIIKNLLIKVSILNHKNIKKKS